ncbi:hypothetical protein K502DRAFT_322486 [Neoconidiobolus thromboides FSU 785]|nr:hypothetical protein K502DRAFT_322486 [Neoconidiobolus thromboides FSU 785]
MSSTSGIPKEVLDAISKEIATKTSTTLKDFYPPSSTNSSESPLVVHILIPVIISVTVIIMLIIGIYKRGRNKAQADNNNNNNVDISLNQVVDIVDQRQEQNHSSNNSNNHDNIRNVNYNANRFEVINGRNEDIIKGENNSVYFVKDSILQTNEAIFIDSFIYFEIEFIDSKDHFSILLGYSMKCSQNVINDNSILLNPHDGQIVINRSSSSVTSVHNFKKGDIIGALHDINESRVDFTCNGDVINTFNFNSDELLLPTIYCTNGVLIKYNLSDTGFLYQRANSLALGIDNQDLPPNYSEIV